VAKSTTISLHNPEWLEQAQALLDPQATYQLTVHSNVELEADYIVQQVGISDDKKAKMAQICALLDYLSSTEKFDKVRLDIDPSAQPVPTVDLYIHAIWTLGRVVIQGKLFGKERYRALYRSEPGTGFDPDRHAQSVREITAALHATGYRSAHVHAAYTPYKPNRVVDVQLELLPGPLWRIESACLAPATFLPAALLSQVKAVLSAMKKKLYADEQINAAGRAIETICLHYGYPYARISYQEQLNHTTHQARLVYSIVLGPVQIIEFVGNHAFTDKQLREKIVWPGLIETQAPPALLAEELEQLYYDAGYCGAQVTQHQEGGKAIFTIVEGPHTSIGHIVLEGVVGADRAEALKKICQQVCAESGYCDAKTVGALLSQVRTYYLSKGWWDVQVAHQVNAYSADSAARELVITIAEGEQHFLKTMHAGDCSKFLAASPYAHFLQLQQPIPFNQNEPIYMRQWLQRAFHEAGMLYAVPTYHITGETADHALNWQIEGVTKPVRFGMPVIVGTRTIKPSWLAKQLLFKAGEPWNPKLLERSALRLRTLGVFESIAIAPAHMLMAEEVKAVVVRVSEDRPFDLRTRLGGQCVGRHAPIWNGFTYKFGSSLVWKNPTHHADFAAFDFDITRFRRDIVLRYSIPWVFGFLGKTDAKIYSIRYDQPLCPGSKYTLYQAVQDGALCALTLEQNHWSYTFELGAEAMKIREISVCLAEGIDYNPALINRGTPYCFIQPTVWADYLDNKMNPTQGWLGIGTVRGLIPLSRRSTGICKFLGNISWFCTPWAPITLAFHARAGFIVGGHFAEINPIERFYLGGAYSLRGYEPDFAPPLGRCTSDDGVTHFVPIGGRWTANATIEARFPVYKALSGVVFTDMGMLGSETKVPIHEDGLLGSTGFGLRYQTPVGPLRFDIGWKWHKPLPQASAYAWFVTLGNSF
jgi:outer membrane protein assembly factor BamA